MKNTIVKFLALYVMGYTSAFLAVNGYVNHILGGVVCGIIIGLWASIEDNKTK